VQLIHGNPAFLSVALSIALVFAPALAMSGEGEEPITVSRDGELFTITITEAMPVEDVLSDIAEALDAEVEGGEDAGVVGPLKLVRVNLHQALREILQKRSFAMQYEEGSGDPALIHIAARKAAPAPEAVDEAAPEEKPPNPFEALLRNKAKLGNPGTAKAGFLEAITKGSRNPNVKECGDLLKLPQNRGKKSETLVTAEGEACPPGIMIFGN
jgi:hypothetical protein